MSESFLDCYDHYFDDIYRYVLHKTCNKWDTEELVSDIFRKAFEHFDLSKAYTYKKAWLMVIARNTVIDFYRKKGRVTVKENMEPYLEPYNFQDALEEKDEIECLKKSMNLLPDLDSEIIQLRYFSKMKFREISELLQQPEATLRVKATRIMKKLGVLISHCLECDERKGCRKADEPIQTGACSERGV
ncbi:RNA polymerase sigma factor [Brevibacillus centrosporus]|uniref:RNA polymerase sigma-70 factor, ECF subfamily n=1 Tax=Brevibacillus centrosporus TaxID=54910 RepID=A0A1I3ZHY4_9BACL|nr:RNA polymerase sigma-70 factor, ECF subfamily [Brevibacillus centrosporus]